MTKRITLHAAAWGDQRIIADVIDGISGGRLVWLLNSGTAQIEENQVVEVDASGVRTAIAQLVWRAVQVPLPSYWEVQHDLAHVGCCEPSPDDPVDRARARLLCAWARDYTQRNRFDLARQMIDCGYETLKLRGEGRRTNELYWLITADGNLSDKQGNAAQALIRYREAWHLAGDKYGFTSPLAAIASLHTLHVYAHLGARAAEDTFAAAMQILEDPQSLSMAYTHDVQAIHLLEFNELKAELLDSTVPRCSPY